MFQFSEQKITDLLKAAKDLINEVETTPSASHETWHHFKLAWLEVMTEFQQQRNDRQKM